MKHSFAITLSSVHVCKTIRKPPDNKAIVCYKRDAILRLAGQVYFTLKQKLD